MNYQEEDPEGKGVIILMAFVIAIATSLTMYYIIYLAVT